MAKRYEDISDEEFFNKKKTDKIYLSRSILTKYSVFNNVTNDFEEHTRPLRIISSVIDTKESHKFIKDGKEVSLRITPGGRQEIKAKFYEDTRGITTLTIQKFTSETGAPHNTYFTFQGQEILTLLNFIKNIPALPIQSGNKTQLDDKWLKEYDLSKEQAIQIIKDKPEILNELLESDLTVEEIATLNKRKSELKIFKQLLDNIEFFNKTKKTLGNNIGDEAVWQKFFEKYTWIFGYGLNYVFNSPLEDKKLEQVVSGYNFNNSGKRIDALLKSRGIISSFCFVEIKTHKKDLLKKINDPYRAECWAISDELEGSIAQVQKSTQKFVKDFPTKNEIKDSSGNLTGEQVFIYQPKSYVIIGNLEEFKTANGVNEDKYSSFELFRQNKINPEIITFDELYERACYIVHKNEENIRLT